MTTPNTETLFDIPEQKSPRLLWIEKHGISCEHNSSGEWFAWSKSNRIDAMDHWVTEEGMSPKDFPTLDDDLMDDICDWFLYGRGTTEADAITDWARKNHVKLWNEEQL